MMMPKKKCKDAVIGGRPYLISRIDYSAKRYITYIVVPFGVEKISQATWGDEVYDEDEDEYVDGPQIGTQETHLILAAVAGDYSNKHFGIPVYVDAMEIHQISPLTFSEWQSHAKRNARPSYSETFTGEWHNLHEVDLADFKKYKFDVLDFAAARKLAQENGYLDKKFDLHALYRYTYKDLDGNIISEPD